jgi:hemoglobin-like flavoprotein
MLTNEQIELIRHSYKRFECGTNGIAEEFYNRLFSLQPALRLLFPDTLEEQKKKLVKMLNAVIDMLDDPERLTPVLEDSGRRHALYGVREADYETVGAALLQTLRETSGAAFDAGTEAAWTQIYAFMSEKMKRGARSLYEEGGVEIEEKNMESKFMNKFNSLQPIAILFLLLTAFAGSSVGQTTIFTYQGKLNDGETAANGPYQFEFRLFDVQTVGTGTQIGGTLTNVPATVVNGIFTVQLDFGANAFNGTDRFLEISVRRNAAESYVALSPRQPLTSAPYAIKSKTSETAITANNTQQLGGVEASQYVQTNDSRMTDARTPLPGSQNYIQNSTTQQINTDFNISGEGKAGVLTAVQQFNIGTLRVLSIDGQANLFVGAGAGAVNIGGFNTFAGIGAGQANTTGSQNTFVGRAAGLSNTTAFGNSFFGRSAGLNTTTGEQNSFFGQEAGLNNTTARYNAFFGALTGRSNTTGEGNSFFGTSAGLLNTTGTVNSFFGLDAGRSNTVGGFNTFVGSAAGQDNTTGGENSFFGRAAGANNMTGAGNTFLGRSAGVGNLAGNQNTFVGFEAGNSNPGNNNTLLGAQAQTGAAGLFFATAVGAGAVVSTSNTIVLGRTNGADRIRIFGLGSGGMTLLCRNANNEISTCSSPFAENGGELAETVKRQQAQIEAQAREIALLKQLVCAQNRDAAVCREENK